MKKHWEEGKRTKQLFWTERNDQKKTWSDKENAAFYHTTAWRKLRNAFIFNNPVCKICKAHGTLVTANVVDHIIPIRYNGAKLDVANLQALCHSCHNRKSASEK